MTNFFSSNYLTVIASLTLWSASIAFGLAQRECAVLLGRGSGNSIPLLENSQVGNLDEIRNFNTSTTSRVVPLSVSGNCEVTACSEYYFGGTCQKFGEGEHSLAGGTPEWSSLTCKCNRNCSCSDVQFSGETCTHAYFNSGGCSTCDSPYTELVSSKPSFPAPWATKIKSLLVRSGCTLRVYPEEDYEGDYEQIQGSLVSSWVGSIGSYECNCDEQISQQDNTVGPSSNAIAQLAIPNSFEEILDILREGYATHPGLLSGFSSLEKRRSPRNFYILVLGSTGAGKSSVINNLLRNANLSLAGEDQSTTSQILEFRIPFPLEELGITNSELRIIDTPGLGDTRGIQQDAVFLASLEDYLEGHEELKKRLPNIVLVVHPFTDNRFDGESSSFVKMIRTLSSFRRITDDTYSNVLFAFSHLCSETKEHQRNPEVKLKRFRDVIGKHSLFPKPILTSAIENKPRESELVMVNEDFELPSREYFPRNLVDKFDLITRRTGDRFGTAMVNSAFRNEVHLMNLTRKVENRFEMVSPRQKQVAHYLALLSAGSGQNEVTQALDRAYASMEASLKSSNHPICLEYLKNNLKMRGIQTIQDVPRTTGEILELLHDLEYNSCVSHLLSKGLNLTAPIYPQNNVVGYSYNIFRDSLLPISPLELSQLVTAPINFKIPEGVNSSKTDPPEEVNILNVFDFPGEYVNARMRSFGIPQMDNNNEAFRELQNRMKAGYYVKKSSCPNNLCALTASKIYKLFELSLEKVQLSPGFTQRITQLPRFNQSNHGVVEGWKNFFRDYGTHVVSKAVGGGRIDIRVASPSPFPVNINTSVFKTVELAENPEMLISGGLQDTKQILPSGMTHTLTFFGGSQAYHASDLTSKLTLEESGNLMRNWRRSLNFSPVVISQEFLPISEILRRSTLCTQICEKYEQAYSRLLQNSLRYIPPPTPDPKILEAELARQRLEHEAQMKRLQEEKRRMEEKAAAERQAQLAAQRKLEQERQALEQRQREEAAAAQRRLEEERQRLLQQQEIERQRAAAEEALRHQQHLQQLREIEERERLERERIARESAWNTLGPHIRFNPHLPHHRHKFPRRPHPRPRWNHWRG